MIVIPAVDLLQGKAVRLLQGDPSRQTVFSSDPTKVAIGWHQQGAERIHVVDLDGSLSGEPANRDIVQSIAQSIPIPVQLGGGIRNLDTAEAYLDAGVDRIVFGTTAVEQPDLVAEACLKWPSHVAVALDALGGQVSVKGWTERTTLTATDLAKRFEGMGVAALIYTDIERDGMQKGVNLESTLALARSVDIPVIASGGVASLEDVRSLLSIASEGIEGVIIGRALYEGAISLEEAIRMIKEETS